MTLHATRDGQAITIHGNTGISVEVRNSQLVTARITENAQHVRFFHDELGKLLEMADAEREVAHELPEHGHAHHAGPL